MTEVIAIYGAITGTAGALGALWIVYHGILRDRGRIRAKLGWGSVQGSLEIEPDKWLWFLEVMNHGRRPVAIGTSPGLEFPNGKWMIFHNRLGDQSRTIREGEKVTFWAYEAAVSEGLKKQNRVPHRILVKDDAGHSYRRRIERKYIHRLRKLLQNGGEVPIESREQAGATTE